MLFDLDDSDFQLNFDPNAYARELVDGASDLSDEEKAVLASALTKQSVAAKLKNSVALRAEAQRKLDKARDVTTKAEQVREANFAWARDNKEAFERWAATQGGRSTITSPSGEVLTKAEVREMLAAQEKSFNERLEAQRNETDEQYIGVLADGWQLASTWNKNFPGEDFPYPELQKFALGKRLSLTNAFPLFIAPKMEEKRKTEIETMRKAAIEEGRQLALAEMEERSTLEGTVRESGNASGAGATFMDSMRGRQTQRLTGTDGKPVEGEDAFVARWKSTNGFTRGERSH